MLKGGRKEITEENVAKAIADLHAEMLRRMKQKGSLSWASRYEASGKGAEEWDEYLLATGHGPLSLVRAEALDVMTVLLWEIASIDAGAFDDSEEGKHHRDRLQLPVSDTCSECGKSYETTDLYQRMHRERLCVGCGAGAYGQTLPGVSTGV